ncbi:hypothetical protein [Corynebacterium oculi]|uniref:hypothetical protein n=1 Tax=Corynebacterium oculi TaxID=1544416 RepID=UPI0012376EF6|nr:hypothetical protein [Corynebacterium oculi]
MFIFPLFKKRKLATALLVPVVLVESCSSDSGDQIREVSSDFSGKEPIAYVGAVLDMDSSVLDERLTEEGIQIPLKEYSNDYDENNGIASGVYDHCNSSS